MIKKNFNILNFFSFLLLFFSFFVLIFVIYKIFKDGSYDYLKYYFYFIFILFLFYFINIFLNHTFKIYIVIISLSIITTLYSYQGFLVLQKINYFKNKNKIIEYERITGKKFDTRSRLEIYEELKKKGNITVSITPYNLRKNNKLEILPLAGISNIKTILCNESGYYSNYKSDRFGFNNPDNQWDIKETYAVLVGDSFVHGSCVNPPNDLGGVLRSKIENKAIINLGQAGNAPLTQYASLREYLTYINNVEKVVWFHYEHNDLYSDFKEELDNKILNNYLKKVDYNQGLIKKQETIDNFLNREKETVLNVSKKKNVMKKKNIVSNFIKLNEVRYKIFKKSKIKKSGPYLNEFQNIMELTKKLVDKNGAKLYFVYLPSYDYVKKNYRDPDYESVKKIIKNLKIPFIDINDLVFKKEENPQKLYPFEVWNHFTVEGYKKVGEAVFDSIN